MRNATRLAFTAYVSQIAMLSNVASAAEKFTVGPTVAQKLEEKTQASSEFLSKINFETVFQQEGERLASALPARSPDAPIPISASESPVIPPA